MIPWTSYSFLHLPYIMNPLVCVATHFAQYSDRLRLYRPVIVVQHLTDPNILYPPNRSGWLASTQPLNGHRWPFTRDMQPTTYLCLEPKLKESGPKPPLPHTFIAWTLKTVPYPVGRPMSFPYVFGYRDGNVQSDIQQSNCSERAYFTISFETIYNVFNVIVIQLQSSVSRPL
jgi:hypothetical protein